MLDDYNSLTPAFKWAASFQRRNNLDELINIPIKAEERSPIQISFWIRGPNIRRARNPRQILQLIHDPLCFQNPPIRSIYRRNPQSVHFLRPHSSIRKPINRLVISKSYQVSSMISRDMRTIDTACDWFGANLSTVIDHSATGPKLIVPLEFGTFKDDKKQNPR